MLKQLMAVSASAAVACGAATAGPLDLGKYASFVGFGDSTADSGNAFIATGGSSAPAAGGYFQGRFSNGLNYFDEISTVITGSSASPSFGGGSNFAFGGARTITDPGGVPDLADQVGAYLAGPVDTGALHAINLGGNDSFGFLFGGGTDINGFASTFAGVYATEIQKLIDAGATDFLVSSVPNVGRTPIVTGFFGGDQALALAFADPLDDALNKALKQALTGLTYANAGVNIFFFDVDEAFAPLTADPASFGLDPSLISTPCNDPTANPNAAAAIASNCAGYIFLDSVHVTKAGQDVILGAALGAERVSEPAGLAILVLGVAGLAFARRRAAA